MTVLCQSWLPWDILSRATFIPPAAKVANISVELLLGPIVHMILVRLVLLKPAKTAISAAAQTNKASQDFAWQSDR